MKKTEVPIDYNKMKKNLKNSITPEMIEFLESRIGRENLSLMTEEAWMDFILGASLWGISVGLTKIV